MTSKQTTDKQNRQTDNARNPARDEETKKQTKQTIYQQQRQLRVFRRKEATNINLSSTSWAHCSDTKCHEGMFLNVNELTDIRLLCRRSLSLVWSLFHTG